MGHALVACFALSTALVLGASSASAGEAEPGEKLPRFVSLRSDQVNLRVGPGENYPIQWVLTRKEMPVEIVKEFEHWRMIHDWQGAEGWVHERMVSGKRTVVVKGGVCALHRPIWPRASSPVRSPASLRIFSNAVASGAGSIPPTLRVGYSAARSGVSIPTKPCNSNRARPCISFVKPSRVEMWRRLGDALGTI